MEELKTIEVAELSFIKVNAKIGANIFNTSKECIALANLLKCAVELFWNGQYIFVYTNSTVESIMQKINDR